MKMTQEHFAELSAEIHHVIELAGIDQVVEFKSRKLGTDHDMRFRWDMFWHISQAKRGELTRKFYKYLNDSHIDTALKAIISKIPELN